MTITHHLGHRDRLRQRFLEAGEQALADYELLEMLLFYTFPRGDTKPLAKDLIDQLGGLQAVFGSPLESIKCVKGAGPSTALFLKLIHAIMLRTMKEGVKHKIVLQSWQEVIDYCKAAMSYLKEEQFRLLFLDQKNQLIADEVQTEGTVNHTAIYPRKTIKRALELGASALVMVHNHPSGDPTPSRADIEITHKVREAARVMGIMLHDHVIIGQGDYISFKSLGFL